MKCEWILYLDVGPIQKTARYAYANVLNRKLWKSEALLTPSISVTQRTFNMHICTYVLDFALDSILFEGGGPKPIEN